MCVITQGESVSQYDARQTMTNNIRIERILNFTMIKYVSARKCERITSTSTTCRHIICVLDYLPTFSWISLNESVRYVHDDDSIPQEINYWPPWRRRYRFTIMSWSVQKTVVVVHIDTYWKCMSTGQISVDTMPRVLELLNNRSIRKRIKNYQNQSFSDTEIFVQTSEIHYLSSRMDQFLIDSIWTWSECGDIELHSTIKSYFIICMWT